MKYFGAWAVAIVTAFCSLWWPMRRDQGVFAWVGDVIIRGGMPYKDAWDVKGPLTHYLYALSQVLFGRTQWGVRVLDLFFLVVTVFFLWLLVIELYDKHAANVAVPVFVLLYYRGCAWNTAQPDGWAGMLMVIAVWLIVSDTGRLSRVKSGAFGLSVGACAALKPLFGCFLLLRLLHVPSFMATRLRKRVMLTLISASSFLFVLLVVAGWFTYRGAMMDLVDTLFSYNLLVNAENPRLDYSEALSHLKVFFSSPAILVPMLFAAVGLKAMWHKGGHAFVIVASWAALSLLCVIIQNKYFYYHWIPFLAPLSIAAGAGVSRMTDPDTAGADKPVMLRMVKGAAVVLLFVSVSIGPLYWISSWLRPVAGIATWDEYYTRFGLYGGGRDRFMTGRKVSRYLETRTGQHDKVLVWGFEPVIYYMSGRPSPTRYGFVQPLVGGKKNVFQGRNRKQFMLELNANPPAYIIVTDNDITPVTLKTSKQYLEDFPELSSYISSGYVLEKQIEDFGVYRMRGGSGTDNPHTFLIDCGSPRVIVRRRPAFTVTLEG